MSIYTYTHKPISVNIIFACNQSLFNNRKKFMVFFWETLKLQGHAGTNCRKYSYNYTKWIFKVGCFIVSTKIINSIKIYILKLLKHQRFKSSEYHIKRFVTLCLQRTLLYKNNIYRLLIWTSFISQFIQ